MAEKTFVKITNKMIYDKLESVEGLAKETNGTVKWHTKAIYALSGVMIPIIGWIVHLALKI